MEEMDWLECTLPTDEVYKHRPRNQRFKQAILKHQWKPSSPYTHFYGHANLPSSLILGTKDWHGHIRVREILP